MTRVFQLVNKCTIIKNVVRIQKEVLPTVHSLCQDVSSEVRASICSQLRFVAEGLGAESVKPALLPSLVELASDEESNVRRASVQTIVYLLPHLQEGEFPGEQYANVVNSEKLIFRFIYRYNKNYNSTTC